MKKKGSYRLSPLLITAFLLASFSLISFNFHVVSKAANDSGVVTENKIVQTPCNSTSATTGGEHTTNDKTTLNKNDLLVAKLSQHKCTDDEFSVRCICGADTHPDYIKNMVETYAQSRYDSSLFEKCPNLTFPFNSDTPLPCWPRMFMLVSYPTGGNELARSILQKAVKRNVFLAQYREPGARTDSHLYTVLAAAGAAALRVHTNNCGHKDEYQRSMPFPMMGKPGIYKSHGPKRWKERGTTPLKNDPKLGGFSTDGIIHLARNPGDQLLRDGFRWHSKKHGCSSHECFLRGGDKFCDVTAGKAWSDWHNFWLDKTLNAPHILYHYENFSNETRMVKATEDVMDFLNEPPKPSLLSPEGEEVEYSLEDELAGIVKEPPYEHGTLMAQICGKDKARLVHESTKEVSQKLGYVFDSNDSATWSLPV